MSSLGASHSLWGPLSAFVEGNVFLMAIRGEPVPEYPALGKQFPTEVSRFPLDLALRTQDSARGTLLFGLRAQLDTLPVSRREIDLLRDARALP
jgi:hypothetical protein